MLESAELKYIEMNKYLDIDNFMESCRELVREDLVRDIIKVKAMYKEKKKLEELRNVLYMRENLGKLTIGELEQIEGSLTKVNTTLSKVYKGLMEDRGSIRNDFSTKFEALVYFVLKEYKEVTKLEYEREFNIGGGLITPDFYFNNNRIVEVKVSRKSVIRNKMKYRKVDANLFKVYLSNTEEEFDISGKGGEYSIGALLYTLSNSKDYNINRDNLTILYKHLEDMIVYSDKSLEYDETYFKKKNKTKVISYTRNLKGKVGAILVEIERMKQSIDK